VYNFSDLVGKSLPGSRFFFVTKSRILFGLTLSRILIIPCFLFVNVQFNSLMPVLFDDEKFFVLVFVLGITNGFLITNSLILAPRILSSALGQRAGNKQIINLQAT
jgi:hypothetical protein